VILFQKLEKIILSYSTQGVPSHNKYPRMPSPFFFYLVSYYLSKEFFKGIY
jgi:hypothetical protein